MPFDGSGNFSRVYDWTSDRDNGIKIRADRMDGEFDDMAAAFNVVFFRNGLVPMSGDLAMGANDIKGIASGTAAAPSIQFSVDPNTGLYLDGAGAIGFSANGSKTFEVNTTGAQVTGALNVSGASTLTGNTTVGGTLGVTGVSTLANTVINGSFSANGSFVARDPGGSAAAMSRYMSIQDAASVERGWIGYGEGTTRLSVTNTIGAINLATAGGAITINGNTAWHAGNDGSGSGLDADLLDGMHASAFALATGAVFTGSVAVSGGSYLQAIEANAGRGNLIRLYADGTGAHILGSYNAGGSGDISVICVATEAAKFTSSNVTFFGNTAWHAGNDGSGSGLDADLLDGQHASAFATLAGATFTGNVGVGKSPSRPLHVYYSSPSVGQFQLVLEGVQGGYGAGVSFQSALGTSGVVTEMARITADGENSWSSTDALTQDAGLRFYTTINGTLAEKMRLNADGVLTVNGNTAWHAGNDGSGSGLDADLLDGQHASAFGQLAAAQTWASVNTFNSRVLLSGGAWAIGSPGIVYANTTDGLVAGGQGTSTDFALINKNGASVIDVATGTTVARFASTPTVSGNTVWHAGNDGSGSGLDADLLDGSHASAFATLAGNNTFTGGMVLQDTAGTSSSMSRYISLKDGAAVERGWIGYGEGNSKFRVVNSIGVVEISASSVTINGNTAWHAGNDGSGSGLDADLLDGMHASAFIQGSGSLGTFSQGTAAPSGGSDGDTYFQYS